MDGVWGGRFVSETAVTSRIKQVRRALGDDGHSQRMIRTLHGRGYQFVAAVTETPDGAQPPPVGGAGRGRARATEPIRYTVSDGLHIAYQVTGGGELDIVLISGFMSHLELDWADPRHAHFLAPARFVRPADPVRQARHRDVGPAVRRAGSRDADARRTGRHGCRRIAAGGTCRVLRGRRRWRSCARRRTPSGSPGWCCTARTPSGPGPRTTRGRRPRKSGGLHREARTAVGLGGGHAAALPRRPTRRCSGGGRGACERPRRPSTVRALMDMNELVDVRDVLGGTGADAGAAPARGRADRCRGARYLAEHIPAPGCAARRRRPPAGDRPGPDPRRDRAVRARPGVGRRTCAPRWSLWRPPPERGPTALSRRWWRPAVGLARGPAVGRWCCSTVRRRAVRGGTGAAAGAARGRCQHGRGARGRRARRWAQRRRRGRIGRRGAAGFVVGVDSECVICSPARGCAPSRPRGRLPPRRAGAGAPGARRRLTGMIRRSRRRSDRHAVGDHVVHRGSVARLRDQAPPASRPRRRP